MSLLGVERLFRAPTSASSFSNDKLSKKYGFINKDGKVILKPKYEFLRLASTDDGGTLGKFVIYTENKKRGILNKDGKVISKAKYDWVAPAGYKGLIKVESKSKYGVLDPMGRSLSNLLTKT